MIKTSMEEHVSDIESFSGLTVDEASRRLKRDGFNELPSAKKRTVFGIALEVIKEPMFILLIACGIIYFLLGDLHGAIMLCCFVFVVIGITIYQEQKVMRALEALQKLSSPRALVIRDGEAKRIPGRDVVRGDIVVLVEGDRVPADAIVISCTNLLIDESLLTGESVPVRKVACAEKNAAPSRPGGDDLPFVYSSTLVVEGRGFVEVKETGAKTEIGKIGRVLQTLEPEETPLQKETKKLVMLFALFGLLVCALIIVLYGFSRGSWLNGFLAGLTLAMALIPEEIPVVLTIFLALGAWRMSQRQVLTRRLHAIDTLGSTTTLCVDKTGTLTMNRMTVKKLFSGKKFVSIERQLRTLSEEFHEILEFSILASQRDSFDPMERALNDLGKQMLAHTEHLHDRWVLTREYVLSKKMRALSHVWKSSDGRDFVVAAKGAPEDIFDLCHLNSRMKEELHARVHEMANEGLRVLGVARANYKEKDLPQDQHDFEFQFVGLVGFEDPIRPNVAKSVSECYDAGIRVIMITGDYPVTAQQIAKQAGITSCDEVITGAELEKMSDVELRRRIKTTSVFARVLPEQKLHIVNALKANGEVVLMTGDGVNDAPALKAAHIGIAMGQRGTEVAREVSSLVLLDDDFSSIVQAVKTGRRIFDNLKKAMAYIFAIHVPIAGLAILPVLFKWPLILFPAHIAFLELIIDPVCSTVFEAEPEENDVMKRPPKKLNEPFFDGKMIILSIMQGIVVLMAVVAVYRIAFMLNQTEEQARALAFASLVVANIALIFTNRSWSRTVWKMFGTPNEALWIVSCAAILCLLATLYVPFVMSIFKFGPLGFDDFVICITAGVASILWFEVLKFLKNRAINHSH